MEVEPILTSHVSPQRSDCFQSPGDEVAIVGDLGEETGLLGESFMGSRVPSSARKKFFNNPRNLKAYSFKPGERDPLHWRGLSATLRRSVSAPVFYCLCRRP